MLFVGHRLSFVSGHPNRYRISLQKKSKLVHIIENKIWTMIWCSEQCRALVVAAPNSGSPATTSTRRECGSGRAPGSPSPSSGGRRSPSTPRRRTAWPGPSRRRGGAAATAGTPPPAATTYSTSVSCETAFSKGFFNLTMTNFLL